MRKIVFSVASLGLIFCASALMAQSTAAPPTVTNGDDSKKNAHDRPVGKIKLVFPGSPSTGPAPEPSTPPPAPPTPPGEPSELPPSESPPAPPPPEDPPTYYGEPVSGKFAFLLDASGSMWGSRVASMRAETTTTINQLTDDDEFDCVAYGSQYPQSQAYSVFLWQSLQPATSSNRSSAITWVNGSATNPGGGTPTFACLQKSCQTYPADLTKMILLTDGGPNVSGSASQILSAFPGWWAKFTNSDFIAVCIGGNGSAVQFMQSLAAIAGGTYISA